MTGLNDTPARTAVVMRTDGQIPPAGWLPRAFDYGARFVTSAQMLSERG